MSGHSKWATIKRQKGATDIKRGAAFTKLSNAISVAVKQGGGVSDPAQNFRLRLAVDAARGANMPKENIQRAIDKASGKLGEDNFDEAVYEGFGPSGVAIIVETATDNKNRTGAEVKNTFERNGGTMGQPGSVSYLFRTEGQIVINKDNFTLDDIMLIAADAGAEDVEEEGNEFYIYTQASNLSQVSDKLIAQNITPVETEIIRRPLNYVLVPSGEEEQKILKILEKLEELNDVQKIYSNFSSSN